MGAPGLGGHSTPGDQQIPRVPGTRQREGVRPGREEGGAWPRAGGGREEGLSRAASGSGGSALPRSVHLGESCSRERSLESSAATAMRGARGAWDLLCVLFVLLRGQTGGRARQTRGGHPLPGGRSPGSGRGATSRGCAQSGGCWLFLRLCGTGSAKVAGGGGGTSLARLAHLRQEPAAAGGGDPEPGVFREPGPRGCRLRASLAMLLCRLSPGVAVAAASGFAPRASPFRARRGRGFLLLKVACG